MRNLVATYRLQMNAGFTIADARARVPYFASLGVSHLYLSPILTARRGSMHGYDVVDPTRVNPEIGTEQELRALADELHARDMGMIVDIVPNHMGIGPENRYWDDVLAHGERSGYAKWFDIDWHAGGHKIVLPVLGDDLDRVLERGELSVRVREGETPRVTYYRQSFPLDPSALPPELQLATFDPEETGELANLFSGNEGRDRLRELLGVQHYRLVHWRRGPDEINYRRFFDVNDLAAVRAEHEEVFNETHALVLGLARDGVIDGVRVDHVDGLRDPLAYLRRLRDRLPAGVPIFVEKILSPGERLRESWPVDGTTGYEFLNDLEDLFVNPSGFAEIERSYRRLRRLPATETFRQIARADKLAVLNGALRPDVMRVARMLVPLARSAGKKWTPEEIAPAIVELIGELPVYRTYIDGHGTIDAADRDLVRKSAATSPQGAFIADLLLDAVPSVDPARRLEFVQRFQQVSGPATAKGVEDTALYVYVPLVSRDEVGGSPERALKDADARFHEGNRLRAERWPRSLLATNTHDTKRSADVRARLDALSEIPHEWDRSVRRWRKLNARHRGTVKGRLAPDTNTEYLIYQILAAIWPPPRAGRRSDDLPDRAWRDAAKERLTRYALKAAREAKLRTTWTEPDAAYESALTNFIAAVLEPSDDAPFLTDVARLVSQIAAAGASNAIARIALHLTSPGTPDIYQGDELWNFTLVDPDNRRQVDYDAREKLIAAADQFDVHGDPFDAKRKMSVTKQLLQLRRDRLDVFLRGDYRPLVAQGPHAEHVVAFARTLGDEHVITVATRFRTRMRENDWESTRLSLPDDLHGVQWRSHLTGETISARSALELASLTSTIPVAILAD